jgi:hypothetical protein
MSGQLCDESTRREEAMTGKRRKRIPTVEEVTEALRILEAEGTVVSKIIDGEVRWFRPEKVALPGNDTLN